MTPQEAFEFKKKWLPNAWSCHIDPDSDIWAKDWCRRNNIPRWNWSFTKHARQDDWHMILFHDKSDFMSFKAAYNLEHKTQI